MAFTLPLLLTKKRANGIPIDPYHLILLNQFRDGKIPTIAMAT